MLNSGMETVRHGLTSLPAASRSFSGPSEPISGTGATGRRDSPRIHVSSASALMLR